MAGKGRFPKGTSGNRRGRPRGIKEKLPRGLIAKIVAVIVQEHDTVEGLKEALRKALKNPRTVASTLEMAGKFTKEIGPNADATGGRPVYITWISNVDPLALRKAAPRALNAKVRTVLPGG